MNRRGHFIHYANLAQALVVTGAHIATKYLSPTHVIRAVRVTAHNRIDKRSRTIDIRFTDGRPNYHARKFIKACVKAGEPFPVRKVQFKFFPKRK